MNYFDEHKIILGDIVSITMKGKRELAKVIMIGETKEHLELDKNFLSWVNKESLLDLDSIIVTWVNNNPLAHNDPNYAPVGNEMFTGIDEDMKLVRRK